MWKLTEIVILDNPHMEHYSWIDVGTSRQLDERFAFILSFPCLLCINIVHISWAEGPRNKKNNAGLIQSLHTTFKS